MRWLAVVLVLALAACTTRLSRDGRTETTFDLKYLAKSDVDRIADTNRAEVVDGLLLIADKLYKRNPNEWKKDRPGQPRAGAGGAAEPAQPARTGRSA
jgi:hypothetical protein